MRTERSETPLKTLKFFGHLTQAKWFKNANMAHVFLYLLLTSKYVRRTGEGTITTSLETETSTRKIAEATGISETGVRRALKGLVLQQNVNFVLKKSKGNQKSVVSISIPNVYGLTATLDNLETGAQIPQNVTHKNPALTASPLAVWENEPQETGPQILQKVAHKSPETLARTSLIFLKDKWLDYTRTYSSSSARARESYEKPTAEQVRTANRQYAIDAANDHDFIGFVSTALLIDQKAVSTLVNIFSSEVNAKATPHTDSVHFRRHFFDWARINITMKNGKRQRPQQHDAALEADRRRYGLPAD